MKHVVPWLGAPVTHLREHLQAALGGAYRIERELGGAGMSAVFLADEVALGRHVVIKVLPPELVFGISGERFRREIHLAASLQHPHIVPLFSAGEAGGLMYYTMPWISGESLRERLVRDGRLPIDDTVRILREVLDALAYAHAEGVVHRDIKPGNVLLSASHALVADFGVAKALSAAGPEEALTASGRGLGTPGYMAPEQAVGEATVDGRADLYAVGVLGYEMLAGSRPFAGTTPQAVVAAQLAGPPERLSRRRGIPSSLEAVVMRCLERRPEDRWQRAEEMVGALKDVPTSASSTVPAGDGAAARARQGARPTVRKLWRSARAPVLAGVALIAAVAAGFLASAGARNRVAVADRSAPPRLAVLYFDDLTPDSSLRHLADGVTEELIHELSGVRAFRVVSRGGVKQYRDRRTPFDSIVSALRVTNLVDGSVQRVGDLVRVRAQLIDASSNTYVDSLSLERGLDEPGALDRTLALQLSAALRRQMGREARLRKVRVGTENRTASDLAFRAQRAREDAAALAARPRAEDVRSAFDALNRADSLLSLAQRADATWLRPVIERGWVAHDRARMQTAADRIATANGGLALADQAVRRAPESAEALELRGALRWLLVAELQAAPDEPNRLQKAEADLRAALDLDSTRAGTWARLGFVLWFKGSTAEADIAVRRALREDAYLADALDVLYQLYFTDMMLGEFTRAGDWCQRGRLTFPNHWRFLQCELTLMRHDVTSKADPVRAWSLVRELETLDPAEKAKAEGRAYHTIARRMMAAAISARAGEHDRARDEIERAHRATEGDSVLRLDLAYDEAYLRLLLGERDRAADLLRTYVAARPLSRDYLARDPLLRDLSLSQASP